MDLGDILVSRKNGCGSSLEFSLPPDSLKGNISTSVRSEKSIHSRSIFSARTKDRMILINIGKPVSSDAQHIPILGY
jgi:hypothetical protein